MEKIADIRKREILESFYQVISNKGIEGASIARIAKLMGVQPGLITHYFKSKDEMTTAVVDFILDKYEEPYFYGIEEISDYQKRYHALLDALFGLERVRFVDDSAFYSCFSLTFRNKKIRGLFEKMYERFANLLAKELTEYMNRGIIRETDAQKAAHFIICLMEGLGYFEQMLDRRQYQALRRDMKETVIIFFRK